jgi:hypothetical protein
MNLTRIKAIGIGYTTDKTADNLALLRLLGRRRRVGEETAQFLP